MRNMKIILGITVAVVLFSEMIRTRVVAADHNATNITVEVLIFSGRRNPTWQLQDSKPLKKLKEKIRDLPEAFKDEPASWARVGFQGFRIWGAESLGLPAQIRIYQGAVKTGHAKDAK